MKFYNVFVSIFCICFQSIHAFDVKVLLATIPKKDLEHSPLILKSTTGFFVGESGQPEVATLDKKVVVTEKNNTLYLNQTNMLGKKISLRPQPSLKQKKDVGILVKDWITDIKDVTEVDFEKLKDLCDQLVSQKKHTEALDSQKLETFFLSWLHQFCEYVTVDKHNSELLKNSLQQSAKKYVYVHSKNMFVTKVSQSQLSKADYHSLGNDRDFRVSFFYKIALQCLQELAQNFLLSLSDQDLRRVVKNSLHGIEYGGGVFWGDMYILEDKDAYLVINRLDIDDYLVSVLQHEGWPGWPLEVNKALIVAARSYLVFKILEAVRCKRLFHIKNSISHQTYKGYCKVAKNVLLAAKETRDLVMTYQGKPVEAMFDSCCGGVIPAKIEGFAFEKVPYLARKKICTHCKSSSLYNWKFDYTDKQVLAKLQVALPDLTVVRDIRVVELDNAKLVKKVMIQGKGKKYYLSGKKMYSLFSEIKSFCFTIKRRNKHFLFHGRGYGHHMGLCQWGARKMVDANWNYHSILKFYYPGIEFVQLSYL